MPPSDDEMARNPTSSASWRRLAALAVMVVALIFPAAASASGALHIRIDGVINPIKARYVHQALEAARARGASFVLMSINTPGGLVSSMEDIVGDMTNSPIPIVAF